ncbi:hypothetical protein IMZ31_24150 (plasmid) [Pontibacillus sp. ALD_SL1]|uniref:hypothetical protein n=1 Tax=Pontibacillus sp. ALD_SL1 TaxID=2777185 RepID=UPI001A965628|nr:hypothetical protein [Pontibacillus sp. ALD_SL1]QST02545.1 hypothetical protein IMZ31_24150 [Pontibacillus sp. ALD_SL1]
MLRTTDYYKMDSHRLVVEPLKESSLTTEEILLLGEGSSVVYYDDKEDMAYYAWERKDQEVKRLFKTINGRIAVVMK